MKNLFLRACLILGGLYAMPAIASPGNITPYIRIDQFGYLPDARKVAVVADPQVGFNAGESFSPGTGANQYQVRRWSDDVMVFSGTLQAWNGGATHTQSGDRGWWFDFSSVNTPGSYYIWDAARQVGSYRFEIGNDVYAEVLRQALRTFYYQRLNYAKVTPYADTRWTEPAWMDRPNQDRFATSRFAKGNMSTARDLHGGWIDAGDLNKYTTFAESAVIQLMEAWRINPGAFTDANGIPESGNGIPDILDELVFELDFLKRMQDATGTNGFFLKVGNDNYDFYNPPSVDPRPRYYLPECTSATLAGAAMFAVCGSALRDHAQLGSYGQDLVSRAEAAWNRAKVTTSNFTSYQSNCDDGDIKSGDADRDAQGQLESAFITAVYLYEATGKTEYRQFAESRYTQVRPYSIWWWGPYWGAQQLALLRLTTLPGVSSAVVNNIRNQKAGMNYLYSIEQYNARTDLYRAHMNDDAYHWGHNQARANAGHFNLDFVTFNINPAQHNLYREVAAEYLHWMHGVNPLGMVMLSNMYAYGGDRCANEIYHTWFHNNTVWDNALTSPKGPAPGYVTGGPNRQYSGNVSGITNQPPQKAYKDWNTEWPENSWEITEPAIYYQAAYILLLARLMPAGAAPPPTDNIPPTVPTNLAASNITANGLTLTWTASTDNVGVVAYEVFRDGNLVNSNVTGTSLTLTGLACQTTYSFHVVARDAAGNRSPASAPLQVTTANCPATPVGLTIYDDAIGADWADWSWGSTRNFNVTNPRKVGARSVRVDFQPYGAISFRKGTAVQTTAQTQLRFWVYCDAPVDLTVYTRSGDETGMSQQVTVRTTRRKWVEITVGMAQLGNPAQIKRVDFQNNTAGSYTLHFDDIRLLQVIDGTGGNGPEGDGGGSGGGPGKGRKAARDVDEVSQPEMMVSPNPASTEVWLHFTSDVAQQLPLKLTDATGRVTAARVIAAQPGRNRHLLPVAGLPSGTYWISMPGFRTAKVVVAR